MEQSDDFLECLKSAGKVLHGNSYLWSIMRRVISISHAKVCVFSDSLCYVLDSILYGKNSWVGSKILQSTELWTHLTENRWISSGIYFTRIHYIAARRRSSKVHEQNEQFQGRILFMSMFNDIKRELKTMNGNALLKPQLRLYLKKNSTRRMVIPLTWIRNKVVFDLQ